MKDRMESNSSRRKVSGNKERWSQMCKVLHRSTLVIGTLSVILPVIFWNHIPEQIPGHYNAAGEVDRYSDKGIIIFLLFVAVLLMGMMSIAVYCVKLELNSRYAKKEEVSRLKDTYVLLMVLNFVLQCMFSYIIFCCASGRELGYWFLPVAGVLIVGPLLYVIIRSRKDSLRAGEEKQELLLTEKQEAGMTYRSKVDWWLGLLLGGTIAGIVALALSPLLHGEGPSWFTVLTAVFVTMLLLPCFQIKYVFYSDHLLISCGFYGKERVRYSQIYGVKETRNPISSAAASLDRIRIDYLDNGRHQTILISPVRKKEFMKMLAQKSSGRN